VKPELRALLTTALAGRYELDRDLGRGGMASVVLARDVANDRLVALKVLHAELAQTVGADRFKREIRVAARLQHPHILTVLDSGEANGQLWFTMPFVEGENVYERLQKIQQFPPDEALRIAIASAEALAFAHAQGVVHRDIKPDNILLSGDQILVADFGVARAVSEVAEKLTATGMIVGTPTYMSPEQASGDKAIDGRSDIFALGCVLYEMLAAEPPFKGPNPQATLMRRFMGPPRPLRPVIQIPEHVEAAIMRALAKDPAERYATADAFAEALAGKIPAAAPAPMVADATKTGGRADGQTGGKKGCAGMVVLAAGLGTLIGLAARALLAG
jgi:serine/threonine-protein kinase